LLYVENVSAGTTWLNNAPTYFNVNNKTHNSSDGTLKLVETSATSGTDKLGQWQSTMFLYQTTDAAAVKIVAVIKSYPRLPIIIFQQVSVCGCYTIITFGSA
jgi:hypothetical protein